MTAMDAADARRSMKRGQRVCVVGVGGDLLVHRHPIVERVTQTLVVTKAPDGTERRFGISDGRSKPYRPYGGTTIHTTCQRPERGDSGGAR
jgi:hypothetical protein